MGQVLDVADVDEMAGNTSGCGHGRAHKMCAAFKALTALEVAV